MRWLAILAFALSTAPAAAQTVPIQSGEHPGFTRLSLLFRQVPDWTLGRVPGGYEVRTGLPQATFATTAPFGRIRRDRVEELETRDGGRLFIAVTCECHANAFVFRQALVIDIRSGRPPSDSRFEVSLEPAGDGGEKTEETVSLALLGPLRSIPLRTSHAWQTELALDLDLRERGEGSGPGAIAEATPVLPPDTLAFDLRDQMRRAAEQGLLTLDPAALDARAADDETPLAETGPERPAPESDTAEATRTDEPAGSAAADGKTADGSPGRPDTPESPAFPGPDTARLGAGLLDTLGNIRIETAVDRGQAANADEAPLTFDGTACLADADLDVAGWGADIGSGAEIGSHRSAIVTELDKADPGRIAALARAYIFLTFGIEARSLMQTFPIDVAQADMLLTLAEIMDTGRASDPGPFRGQIACESRAALWAVLAHDMLPAGEPVARTAILSAFSELPLHMRRHLGPFLADRFLAAGDVETAASLRNAVARAPGAHGDPLTLMDAGIALEEGEIDAGIDGLDKVAAGNGALAPEALVALIEVKIAEGRPVPPRLRDNAAALAFTHRGAPLGAELRRVQIRALAYEGDFAGALEELSRDEVLPDATHADVRLEVLDRLTRNAETEAFLRLALSATVDGGSDRAAKVRRAMAARMIELGFPEPARRLLSSVEGLPSEEDRLLYAQAYLSERRPDLVLGYLAGLSSPQALDLRARAHELAGEFGPAADVYASLDDAERQARAAWRGQDWDAADPLSDDLERAAVELALSAPENAAGGGDAAGPIAASRRLLAGSAETRRILQDLLKAAEATTR